MREKVREREREKDKKEERDMKRADSDLYWRERDRLIEKLQTLNRGRRAVGLPGGYTLKIRGEGGFALIFKK